MIDRVEGMLASYENGSMDRRQFVTAVAALAAGSAATMQAQAPSLFRSRVVNHVTVSVADVARSRAFYQGLLGATDIGAPSPKFSDLRVGSSFIGLYPLGNPGRIDHFSVGIDDYEADRVLAAVKQRYPESKPNIAGDREVYLTDPDGVRLQLSQPDLKL